MPEANDPKEATQVSDGLGIFEDWDVGYYPLPTQRLYDRSVGDMLDLLEVEPGGEVLDAGCGSGVLSIRAAKRGLPSRGPPLGLTITPIPRHRVRTQLECFIRRQADLFPRNRSESN